MKQQSIQFGFANKIRELDLVLISGNQERLKSSHTTIADRTAQSICTLSFETNITS